MKAYTPGVDVMISIFGEKMAFFSKTNVVVWEKRQNFRQIFRRKFLQIITLTPGELKRS
jgi:hypothetical protein